MALIRIHTEGWRSFFGGALGVKTIEWKYCRKFSNYCREDGGKKWFYDAFSIQKQS